jgi:membrane protein DedA with SNARE-associated domain
MPDWLDWLSFDQIAEWVSGAWWSYPVIFAVSALDAFFPLVPSETTVITAGVFASSGDLNLFLIILFAGAGAVVGDNISYGIGKLVGERTLKRWFRSEKSRKRLEWAEHQLDERGAYIILIGRFIPGGRTAVTFASGYTHALTWRRFLRYDIVAGFVWATYAALLGFFGGKTFEENPLWGLLLAFAVASAIAVGVELVRHYRRRWKTPSA